MAFIFRGTTYHISYRVGESNSTLTIRGIFGVDIHLIRIDPLKELLIFGHGFGHCSDHCFCCCQGTKIRMYIR
jgi:hypothetical protein